MNRRDVCGQIGHVTISYHTGKGKMEKCKVDLKKKHFSLKSITKQHIKIKNH